MYCMPHFVLLALLVATASIHFEEQALVAGTKQNRHAEKAVRPACFVFWLLLGRVLTSGFFLTNIPWVIYFSEISMNLTLTFPLSCINCCKICWQKTLLWYGWHFCLPYFPWPRPISSWLPRKYGWHNCITILPTNFANVNESLRATQHGCWVSHRLINGTYCLSWCEC